MLEVQIRPGAEVEVIDNNDGTFTLRMNNDAGNAQNGYEDWIRWDDENRQKK